jgi:hypothetical protein
MQNSMISSDRLSGVGASGKPGAVHNLQGFAGLASVRVNVPSIGDGSYFNAHASGTIFCGLAQLRE